MEDVELVIKIPKELYKAYKGRPPMLGDAGIDMIAQSIANGTPLPKGHGRLIDVNDLKHAFIRWSMVVQGNFTECDIASIIYNSTTIIEADTKSEVCE